MTGPIPTPRSSCGARVGVVIWGRGKAAQATDSPASASSPRRPNTPDLPGKVRAIAPPRSAASSSPAGSKRHCSTSADLNVLAFAAPEPGFPKLHGGSFSTTPPRESGWPDGTSPRSTRQSAAPVEDAPPRAGRPYALLDRCRGRASARVVGGEGYAVTLSGATLSAALDGNPPVEVVPLRSA